ncbi:N1R/p28-like protein [Mythimna separata entomopoxvirus 'L']|uniref:N1R/p28-like protein n=1 Tax=Mythimna separata entomopoxvirus 'L' TaxID=1293572 RepID=A0A916P1H3_9POXV|nr:N1R/p28-like protein [Mythimna separata entomopoxvirus 'L']CCU56337.1 N1R/p28-like protein [Mythimna separata entomopoxvirus 'L']
MLDFKYNIELPSIEYIHLKKNYYLLIFNDELSVIIDSETKYFNATYTCKHMNKNINNWLKSEYIMELIDMYDCDNIDEINSNRGSYYPVKITGKPIKHNSIIRGIYIYKYLFLELLKWISNDLYNKYSIIIYDYDYFYNF